MLYFHINFFVEIAGCIMLSLIKYFTPHPLFKGPYHHVDKQWTLKIFQELLEGVYYIHSMGVMHRDIKVSKILTRSLELWRRWGLSLQLGHSWYNFWAQF